MIETPPALDSPSSTSVFVGLREPVSIDLFNLKHTVGTGTFGRVRLASLKSDSDQNPLAIKIIKKSEVIRQGQLEHLKSEISILRQISHPFIIPLISAFQDNKNVYLVFPFINGGEMFTFIRKQQRISLDHARFYLVELILIFEYLHNIDIIYRDTKPENILIDRNGHIVLTDFGFAKKITDRTFTQCGTPEYLAPEIIKSRGHGKGVDWWASGVLLFELICGCPPFYDENPIKIYEKVIQGKLSFPKSLDNPKYRDVKDLITQLLIQDRTKRLGCLKNGTDDVKNHRFFKNIDWIKAFNKQMIPYYLPPVKLSDDTSLFDQYQESEDSIHTLSPVIPYDPTLFNDLL
jgi:protein kinase X